jgi:hypothetical protein
MAGQAWDVRIPFSDENYPFFSVPFLEHEISGDTVWFDSDMTWQEVKDSLVDHDGYPANIIVRKSR